MDRNPPNIEIHHLNTGLKKRDYDFIFVLDIGGTLTKVTYASKYSLHLPIPIEKTESKELEYEFKEEIREGIRMSFMHFETRNIEQGLDFIKENIMSRNFGQRQIKITGGGAHKYSQLIQSRLGLETDKLDEMESIIRGCAFLLANVPDELFIYNKDEHPPQKFISSRFTDTYPFLLVNIGSGISILKVESPTKYVRVGGTSIGGGTFTGLSRLILGTDYTFDQLLEMANQGDHKQVDMLVKDIYGGSYESLGLPGDLIASSFGMANRKPNQTKQDFIKSLLITIANNIGQLAYLYASLNELRRVIFGGSFIRAHVIPTAVISYGLNYWSNNNMSAMFLRHEGFLGTIGAFVSALEEFYPDASTISWLENFSTFSGSGEPETQYRASSPLVHPTCSPCLSNTNGSQTNLFEMPVEFDQFIGSALRYFPLLKHNMQYFPDTWDMTQDEEARNYWLDCFEAGIKSFQQKAVDSDSEKEGAVERAQAFANRYKAFLQERREFPSARGVLTVRSLLDAKQYFLRGMGFWDPFRFQKLKENRAALKALPHRLLAIDKFDTSWDSRQTELVFGILAGNVFDWGAKEARAVFSDSNPGSLECFNATMKKIPSRPWLIDSLNDWLELVKDPQRRPRSILIFIDNSGADIILGIFPLVREFLSSTWTEGGKPSRVFLVANTGPAINDVTIEELNIIINNVCAIDKCFEDAVKNNRLILLENGQSSPCLDLRFVSKDLREVASKENIDLIILEGMGRAIHTNFNAEFCVNCLKIAVIKNLWLARRLGGDLFSVVLKLELSKSNLSVSSCLKDISYRASSAPPLIDNTLDSID